MYCVRCICDFNTVQTSEPSLSMQRATPQEVIKPPQPQCSGLPPTLIPGRQPSQPGSSSGAGSLPPSCNQLRSPGTLDMNVQSQQSSRPNLVRKNTEVKIVDDSAPNSPAAAPEDSEQRQSLLRQSTVPHISERTCSNLRSLNILRC